MLELFEAMLIQDFSYTNLAEMIAHLGQYHWLIWFLKSANSWIGHSYVSNCGRGLVHRNTSLTAQLT